MRRATRRTLWLLGGAVTLACALAVALAASWWRTAPNVDFAQWRQGPPPPTWSTIERQRTVWRDEGLRRRVQHEFVPLEELPIEVPLAVLVNEDIGFFGHGPLDWGAIWEVIGEWLEGGRLRGASTVSQQLAKCLFLSPEKTLSRKLSEARLAWWLERTLGKRRVLEVYLNVVEFGPGLFGAQAAASRYFGCDGRVLSAEQAAGLAAAVPSPGRDNPSTGTQRWQARRATILRRMERATWLRQRLERTLPRP